MSKGIKQRLRKGGVCKKDAVDAVPAAGCGGTHRARHGECSSVAGALSFHGVSSADATGAADLSGARDAVPPWDADERQRSWGDWDEERRVRLPPHGCRAEEKSTHQ